MKPCPACGNPDVSPNHSKNFKTGEPEEYRVYCNKCWLSGPETDGKAHPHTEEAGIALWDAMPRRGDVPAVPLTLEVEGITFHIGFSVVGPVTFCHIVHKDAVIDAVPLTYSIGSAMCNARDAFDFATGEKVAMRDACNNLDTWFFISGQDPDHRRKMGRKLYSAYRKHLRAERGEWPFKQPEAAKVDIAELVE